MIRSLDDPQRSEIAILVVTASELAGDHKRCAAAGMNGYVTKPSNPGELCSEVERIGNSSACSTA